MTIYFPDKEATFIHIPKTAGVSFKQWVYSNVGKYQEVDLHLTVPEAQKVWPNLGKVIIFVRNPYDRLVSMFHHLGQKSEKRYNVFNNNNNLKKHPDYEKFKEQMKLDTQQVKLYKKGFEYWICSQEEFTVGWSKRSLQVDWFPNCTPEIVIKLESINHEFIKLQKLFNCYSNLPVFNSSEHDPYKNYYNTKSKSIAEQLIQKDLEAFGYGF